MRLVADNLSIDRGGRTILDGVSFTAASGEVIVLTGPNGAGKTTLMRAVAGFLPLAGGSVRLEGATSGDEVEIAERCHFIGHRDGIKGALTVAENAVFFSSYLSASSCPGEDKQALERLGLGALADVPAAWLSAGQRRRLGLARLLLARRPIWLLDEPTVSLDAAAVKSLTGIMDEHRRGGGILIAATHVPLGLDDVSEMRLGPRAESAE